MLRVWPGGCHEGRRRVRSVRVSERPVMNLGVWVNERYDDNG